MAPVTMKDDALPQIHLVRDTDLGVFAYELHILAGDFLRESEFNLRSLATNTGPDSIAIMGKNHIWLADALSAYYPTGELYRMAAMTEYPGARAFLFHTERKEDGRLYGDVLMTDLDTLRQDIERNTLYPYGVNMEYRDGTKAEAGIEKWEAMELCEKDALKTWHYLYAPEQVTEWQYRYRGEIHAIISNVSNQTQELSKGSRVGQLVITPVVIADFVTELGEQRGTGGFGSTGK